MVLGLEEGEQAALSSSLSGSPVPESPYPLRAKLQPKGARKQSGAPFHRLRRRQGYRPPPGDNALGMRLERCEDAALSRSSP